MIFQRQPKGIGKSPLYQKQERSGRPDNAAKEIAVEGDGSQFEFPTHKAYTLPWSLFLQEKERIRLIQQALQKSLSRGKYKPKKSPTKLAPPF